MTHQIDPMPPTVLKLARVAALRAFVYPPSGNACAARADILAAFGKPPTVHHRTTYDGQPYSWARNDLPRNPCLEIREVRGFRFVLFPVSYPGLKRLHVECPGCGKVTSVGHYMMHARACLRKLGAS